MDKGGSAAGAAEATETTTPAAVDPAALLAELGRFWEHPVPDRFGGGMPRRIAGSQHDQAVPAGVSNPYWEIVRQLPVSSIDFRYLGRYAPDAHWFGPDGQMYAFASRTALCATFAWSVASPGDIAWIAGRLAGRGIAEPGAGLGYWAWQLAQAGVDVVAYDPAGPDDNAFVAGKPWFPVLPGDHSAVKDHPDRSLLLCWPSYSMPWASWALANYGGDQVFYAGESEGGCCADDEFFGLLDAGWDEVGSSPHHVTYFGIHCDLTEYRRKGS